MVVFAYNCSTHSKERAYCNAWYDLRLTGPKYTRFLEWNREQQSCGVRCWRYSLDRNFRNFCAAQNSAIEKALSKAVNNRDSGRSQDQAWPQYKKVWVKVGDLVLITDHPKLKMAYAQA